VVKNINVNPEEILKDFSAWYNYTYHNIRLAQDFIGMDKDAAVIEKAAFLRLLSSGRFVPLKTALQNNKPVYRLHSVMRMDENIKNTVLQMASSELEHYNMEGKMLPPYEFTDLAGNRYNASSTRGKVLLLKCWFINCFACVQEFPELNKLVETYKNRKDILFVSLASDAKQDLLLFLQKRKFNYAVVPEKGSYMEDQLKVSAYPTHILVNKKGAIVKVTNAVEDMLPFLERIIGEEPPSD
jgi:thiol-disulfide isomerase/thioredoxin